MVEHFPAESLKSVHILTLSSLHKRGSLTKETQPKPPKDEEGQSFANVAVFKPVWYFWVMLSSSSSAAGAAAARTGSLIKGDVEGRNASLLFVIPYSQTFTEGGHPDEAGTVVKMRISGSESWSLTAAAVEEQQKGLAHVQEHLNSL